MTGVTAEIVIDASAAVSFILSSQSTPAAKAFLEERSPARLIAPSVFTWEVTNVLVRLGLRGMHSGAFEQALDDIAGLEIVVQVPPPDQDVLAIAREALKLGLRVFDTAYLLLAMDHSAALASRDERLLSVALARGVACIDLR